MEFLLKLGFWQKWFGSNRDESRSAARERLRGALVGDRSSVAPNLLPALEGELQGVLSRYFDLGKNSMRLSLAEREGLMHFSLQVPVQRVHRQARLPHEALEASKKQRRVPHSPSRGPRRRPETVNSAPGE